jgi:frataxin-like iron-binding protein CyaY
MKNKKVMSFDKMMKKVSDLVENDLKEKKIYYERNGTIFNVEPHNMSELLKSQYKANSLLFKNGEFTKDMLIKM